MKSVSHRRRADFIRVPLAEARVARMWSAVVSAERSRIARLRGAPLRARRTWILIAAALGAAILVAVLRRPAPAPALAGLSIDTGTATQEISLPEGSALHLGAATRLRVLAATAGEIRLRLDRGSVVCDVIHRDDRRFVVEAGDVEVEDRGTRFAVEVSPTAGTETPGAGVTVRVERGAVEVHDTARTVLAALRPGQSWSSASPAPAPTATETSAPAEPPSPAPEEIPRPPPPRPPAPRGGDPTPQALFERADAARLAGHHAEAAAAFERFYRRFPDDPRAALAAYELGRIRLGSLHDPRGAAEAFGAVLDHRDDTFREGAEAGRVEALADLGDEVGCRRARDAFLARYPGSPQARRVGKLCGR